MWTIRLSCLLLLIICCYAACSRRTPLEPTISPPAATKPSAEEPPLIPPTKPEESTELKLPPRKDTPKALLPREGELHAVGVYRGEKGKVKIVVKRRKSPIILALSAYDRTKWDVEVENGADLAFIILSGYHKQDLVTTLPAEKVLRRIFKEGDYNGYLMLFQDDTEPKHRSEYSEELERWVCTDEIDPYFKSEYRKSAEELKRMTGMNLTTIQGEEAGTEFEITDETEGSSLRLAQDYCKLL